MRAITMIAPMTQILKDIAPFLALFGGIRSFNSAGDERRFHATHVHTLSASGFLSLAGYSAVLMICLCYRILHSCSWYLVMPVPQEADERRQLMVCMKIAGRQVLAGQALTKSVVAAIRCLGRVHLGFEQGEVLVLAWSVRQACGKFERCLRRCNLGWKRQTLGRLHQFAELHTLCNPQRAALRWANSELARMRRKSHGIGFQAISRAGAGHP